MGVLGWAPILVEFSNIPDLILAYEAKIEWHNQTNGVKEKDKTVRNAPTIEDLDELVNMR